MVSSFVTTLAAAVPHCPRVPESPPKTSFLISPCPLFPHHGFQCFSISASQRLPHLPFPIFQLAATHWFQAPGPHPIWWSSITVARSPPSCGPVVRIPVSAFSVSAKPTSWPLLCCSVLSVSAFAPRPLPQIALAAQNGAEILNPLMSARTRSAPAPGRQ
jgi:hypothetical protein